MIHRVRVSSPLTLALCAFTWLSATPASSQSASPESPAQLEQACTAGDAQGCNKLGSLYMHGLGVPQDDNRAAALFDQACKADQADACLRLGRLHTEGRGVKQDEDAALALFQKACALGDARACLSSRTAAVSTSTADDDEERRPLHLLLSLGLQFGGEALVELTWSDGSESSRNAGDGLTFALGAMFEPVGGESHALQLQASAGYSYAGVEASNGSASWTHWPVELLAFYNYKPLRFRVGAGLQHHFNVSFEGSGLLSSASSSFDNATGAVLEADWMISPSFSLYGRYTIIRYSVPGTSVDFSGNAFGMGFSWLPRIR